MTDARWEAVRTRDGSRDGQFVYAVRTTGVFCRPSCPARRPRRDHVVFYDAPADARADGFRPCLRCAPEAPRTPLATAVRTACRLLERGATNAEVAGELGWSPSHLQRRFKAALGVTPQQYRRRARAEGAREGLAAADSVADAALAAGFGSVSRFYAGIGPELGMAPAAARRGGAGERIAFAVHPCTLGRLLVAWTDRGVCEVGLGDDDDEVIEALRAHWPGAELAVAPSPWGGLVDAVEHGRDPTVPLDIRGTAFQERVWTALRRVPAGETRTYAELARELGMPSGARAVAGACAVNRVAVAVPCHRVIRGDGDLAGYRWGRARKAALLDRERRGADEPSVT